MAYRSQSMKIGGGVSKKDIDEALREEVMKKSYAEELRRK